MNAFRVTAHASFSFIATMSVLLASLHVEAAPPVQVSAADPSSAPQGTIALDVAVSGSGFDSSAAVDFLVTGTTNPGGITVKRVNFVTSKKLIVTIDVADTATVAQFDIEVKLTGGRKGKGTSLFAVQKAGTQTNPAFAVDPNQQYKDRVVTLESDGAALTTLTGPLIDSPGPRWSPDGRSIVYRDRLPMLLVRMDSRTGAVQAAVPAESLEQFDWSNGNVGSCGDLIVYPASRDARSTGFESDLVVTNPAFSQNKKLVMSHDLDDVLSGNDADPDTYLPAWSHDGRYIAASSTTKVAGSTVRTLVLYAVSCASGVDVTVDSEITLFLSFGAEEHWWNNFSWNSSGQYLAMTVQNSSDGNLWIADLGGSGQSGYPDATPDLYRLTGVGRPFGSGAERVLSAAFAPGADTIAFVTQGSSSDRTDSLYTISAGACVAALGGVGSVSAGCAATLVSKGINAYHIDWRPNWPTPLQ